MEAAAIDRPQAFDCPISQRSNIAGRSGADRHPPPRVVADGLEVASAETAKESVVMRRLVADGGAPPIAQSEPGHAAESRIRGPHRPVARDRLLSDRLSHLPLAEFSDSGVIREHWPTRPSRALARICCMPYVP